MEGSWSEGRSGLPVRGLRARLGPISCSEMRSRPWWLQLGQTWSMVGMGVAVGGVGRSLVVEGSKKENKVGSWEVGRAVRGLDGLRAVAAAVLESISVMGLRGRLEKPLKVKETVPCKQRWVRPVVSDHLLFIVLGPVAGVVGSVHLVARFMFSTRSTVCAMPNSFPLPCTVLL